MKKHAYLLLFFVFLLAIAACGGEEATATPEPTAEPAQAQPPAVAGDEIQNIVWQWVKVTNQATGDTTTVPNPENYTIVFNPDRTVNIQADCNMVGGNYTLERDAFTIQLGPSTLAFCGEDSLDQQYLELLSNVVAGGPDGAGGLALETAGGEQRMEFQDGGPAAEAGAVVV